MEFSKFLETAAAGAIPFAADLFNSPIFFKDWKLTYKTVSAIFAAGLFMYIRFSDPNTIFLPLETWWLFLLAAFVLLVVYIGLHIYNNQQVDAGKKRPVLITGLFVFTVFYTCLSTGFCLLFQNINYDVVKCRVVDKETKKPVTDAKIMLYYTDSAGVAQPYEIGRLTNTKGETKMYVAKEKLQNLKFYEVYQDNYRDLFEQPIDNSMLNNLQYITMTKL